MKKLITLSILCLVAGTARSKEIPEYCLENNAVQHYIHDFEYDDDDYTYTNILDYCDPEPYKYYKYDGYRKDRPEPASLEFPSALPQDGILYVSENSDFSDSLTYNVKAGATGYDVYNLIPGRTYYYKVECPEKVCSDVFRTTGTLRQLNVEGIFNVRDMGGWIGLGGNPIKYGKLFRGSRMTNNGSGTEIITAAGKKAMLDAGIRGDLDLRTSSERNLTKSPLANNTDVKVDYYPIDDSYKSRISTFDQSDASIRGIKWIISELKKDRPVYFHCSVGADRTGTVAFLIGALCGMSESDLAKEFELTSFSADSVVTNGKIEDLRRRRTYDGRFDNTEKDYKYALLIEKVKALTGNTLQRKVYNHLKNGVQSGGEKIKEDDLDWLVTYLTGYKLVRKLTAGVRSISLKEGESYQLTPTFTPADATDTLITYRSLKPEIATVTPDGLVTAVSAGSTYIYISIDGLSASVKTTVTADESGVMHIKTAVQDEPAVNMAGQQIYAPAGMFIQGGKKYIYK
jgi:protein tyrosine/serine phosphatase